MVNNDNDCVSSASRLLTRRLIAVVSIVILALISMSKQADQMPSIEEMEMTMDSITDNITVTITDAPLRSYYVPSNNHNHNHNHTQMCETTKRCTPIRPDEDYISYVHISKNSGSSWIQEFKKIKGIPIWKSFRTVNFTKTQLYPMRPSGPEHSLSFQDVIVERQHRDGPLLRFLTLRNPRQHAWSLFNMCANDEEWGKIRTNGTNFPRNHSENLLLDFREWLHHFANETTVFNQTDAFRCYHPANYQSRALVVHHKAPHNVKQNVWIPSLTKAEQAYWSLDGVSLTGFFHESKCLLYYRVHLGNDKNPNTTVSDYVEQSCQCNAKLKSNEVFNNTNRTNTNTNTSSQAQLQDIQITYASETRRTTMTDVPDDILQLIDILTSVDQKLYRIAVQQLIKEIHWMEYELGRRVLCDPVLDKWEPELEYLNVSLKGLYHGNIM